MENVESHATQYETTRDDKLTITNGTPYRCVNPDCKITLCIVEGRKIGFPLVFGYSIVIELKKNQQYENICCPGCKLNNRIRGETKF